MIRVGARLRWFQYRLRRDAVRITTEDLQILLGDGRRERLTAAWLAAAARRTELREQIGRLLYDSEMVYAGRGYCVAVASFGTPPDADLLCAYLDRWLPRSDCRYDQPDAIGALLHLDAQLGTHHADRFLTPGGPWERWRDEDTPDPAEQHQLIEQFCALASGTPRPDP